MVRVGTLAVGQHRPVKHHHKVSVLQLYKRLAVNTTFTDSLNGATDARCAMVVVYGVRKETPDLHGSRLFYFI
jgi:hypothetical protein